MNDTRKRRRWPFVLVGAVLLLAVAAFVATRFIDVERLRAPLERALAEQTGWEASLGEIDYSLTGGLVVRVAPATLDDPSGDGRVAIESIEVAASPWSLFGGSLRIDEITLVRPELRFVRESEQAGWSLPMGGEEAATDRTGAAAPKAEGQGAASSVAAGDAGDAPSSDAGGSSLTVAIERIRIQDGRAELTDRAKTPATSFALEAIEATLQPTAERIELSTRLAGDGGRLSGGGRWTESIVLDVEALRSEALHPFLGPDVLHGGALVDGTLTFEPPMTLSGDLAASDVLLLAGVQSIPEADVDFRMVGDDRGAVALESLGVAYGESRLTGSGSLAPDLGLDLTLHDSPIEAVVASANAVFPFPLEFRSPGRGSVDLRIDQPAGGEMSYSAAGSLTAAGFSAAEFLPEAEALAADFTLSREGELRVELLQGEVAGGPLHGVAILDKVAPVGKLTFEGGLQQTPLGALLAGFIGTGAAEIRGPSALEADIGLDLSAGEVGVAALAGSLSLGAQNVEMPGWDLESQIAERLQVEIDKLGSTGKLLDALSGGKVNALQEQAAERAGSAGDAADELLQRMELVIDFDQQPWNLQHIAFDAGGFQADGSGTFSPTDGVVDLNLTALFSPEKTAELVDRYGLLSGLVKGDRLALPMSLDGPITTPIVGVDVAAAGDKLLEQRTGDAKEKVKGLIRGLLGDR